MSDYLQQVDQYVSSAEELLWLAERTPAIAPTFVECPRHFPIALRLENRVDHRALERAVGDIVRRHEPLRGRFGATGERPIRATAPELLLALPVADLTGAADGVRTSLMRSALDAMVTRRFDIAAGPLLRMLLIRLDECEHVFILVVHHIAFDGWSRRVLLAELGALYAEYVGGEPARLPELRPGYGEYLASQQEQLDSPRIRRAAAYWCQQLHGVGELRLASDRPDDGGAVQRSGTVRFTVPSDVAQALHRLGRLHRTTLAVTTAALFALLLAEAAKTTKVVFGVPLSDRERGRFDHLVGLFLNLAIVGASLHDDPPFPEFLSRVRTAFAAAYEHGDVPYGHLLRVLGDVPHLSRNPVRHVFNFVDLRSFDVKLAGLEVSNVPLDGEPPSVADLSLHLVGGAAGLKGRVIYRADLFDAIRIAELANRYLHLVDQVLRDPTQRISHYSSHTIVS